MKQSRVAKFSRVVLNLAALACLFAIPSSLAAAPTFTRETGIRISSAAPLSIDASTAPMRMYFLRNFQVFSATSADGLSWSEESGIRLSTSTGGFIAVSSVTGFSQIGLTGGGYHALYSNVDSSGVYRINTATSTDGLNWAVQASTAIDGVVSDAAIRSPQLLRVSDLNWRLYYAVSATSATSFAFTAQSIDSGSTWTVTGLVSSQQAGEISVSTRTDGKIRAIFTSPLTLETTYSQLLSGLSLDTVGSSFADEIEARFSTGSLTGSLSYPLVVIASETFRRRLYYAFTAAGSSIPHVYSALTVTPDIQRVTPSSLNRNDPPTTLSIVGEVFSPTIPSVLISKTGQSNVAGTSVARSDDQNVSAVIDPLNKDLGSWTVEVTNSDGQIGTLVGVTITFAGGNVELIDNLLRPLAGARTRIDATVFDSGNLRVRLYTLEGKLVSTLFNGDVSTGTSTIYWDGKNDDGSVVASGVYVARIEGPKLDAIEKIVVIK